MTKEQKRLIDYIDKVQKECNMNDCCYEYLQVEWFKNNAPEMEFWCINCGTHYKTRTIDWKEFCDVNLTKEYKDE